MRKQNPKPGALLVQAEQPSEDTERLDWFIEQSILSNGRITLSFLKTDGEGGEPYFECRLGNNFNSDFKGYAGKTMREAIDAARSSQPKNL